MGLAFGFPVSNHVRIGFGFEDRMGGAQLAKSEKWTPRQRVDDPSQHCAGSGRHHVSRDQVARAVLGAPRPQPCMVDFLGRGDCS